MRMDAPAPLLTVATTAAANDSAESLNERTYQKLAARIGALIAGGEFAVGARLPSERALAERFEDRAANRAAPAATALNSAEPALTHVATCDQTTSPSLTGRLAFRSGVHTIGNCVGKKLVYGAILGGM